MPRPIRRTALCIVVPLFAALGQTPSRPPLTGGATYNQDFCSSNAACYTPARGSQCPQVRFGWGNCPGSRQACDWCYGPNGVFAYSPRGSQYTLASGCNQLGSNATWSTQDPQVAQWMSSAGGNCTSDGRGGYSCSNVDASQFKQAANCGNSGSQPPPQQPAPQQPAPSQPQPSQPSNASTGDCSCYTPARGPQCPQVRFGWGDCPGSRQACDWCYGPNGVFAYSPRGSQYTLASGCDQLGSNAIWSTQSSQVAQSMSNAGGNCTPDGKGGYSCSNVDPAKYQQSANCGNSGCSTSPPDPGSGAAPISGTLPPTYTLSDKTAATCQKVVFTYFYINGVNTPMTNLNWRGNYISEYRTVGTNLVLDISTQPGRDPKTVLPPGIPPIPAVAGTIKVANEVDQMYSYTHNPSGADPLNDAWYQDNCVKSHSNPLQCKTLELIDNFRSGHMTNGFALGDLWECFIQAANGFNYVDMALKDDTSKKIIKAIIAINEQPQTQNYFIIVAHSQGNFFAEAIAKFMKDAPIRREIFEKRLGIVALASPTDYSSLKDPAYPGFITDKIVHHTRADDAINVVATLAQIFGMVGLSAKMPFASNDPPLWDWPSGLLATFGFRPGLLPSHDPRPRPDLFGVEQLVTLKMGPRGPEYTPGWFFQRLGYASGVPANQNPELYAPLLSSHLLDDYLDKPPATKAGTHIRFQWGLVPWVTAPQTTSVLECIRGDLMALKTNLLMKGSMKRLDNTTCPGYQ